jgi:hypothetical protein
LEYTELVAPGVSEDPEVEAALVLVAERQIAFH